MSDATSESQAADAVYVSFASSISEKSINSLLSICCEFANAKARMIYLLLSSDGGSVTHAIHAYRLLLSLPCEIVTHNIGQVDSAGNVLFMAGEQRYACPMTSFLFHGIAYTLSNPTALNLGQLAETHESIAVAQSKVISIIAEHASFQDSSQVESLFSDGKTVDATYALHHGIIHAIRDVEIPVYASIIHVS